ncbi:hypothetical protein PQX77_002508 [Marasmius sp. AFHP31]|nr:hypothetical protein PQX77_002508 [Marasmius sp. AFHP31]
MSGTRELVLVPWIGTEVRVTRGPQSGCIGHVKMAERVEGRFGRRLMVGLWVDALKKLVLADHDHMLTTLAQQLRDAQPLSETQNRVYGISRSLLTGCEPWLGTRVRVTKGQLKGQIGMELPITVEELDRSEGPGIPQWSREETEAMRTDTTLGTHWNPNSISPYPISAPATPQWPGHEMEDMRFSTTAESAWDPNASSPLPAGTTTTSPPLTQATNPPNSATGNNPLNPSEQAAADRLEEFCLRVQACIEGQDVYLDIVARGNGATAQRKVDGTNRSIHDITTVQHARDLIKPSTEKNLMVVIGGDSQHTGKLVRRVSNFYLGSKSEENHWIIVGVIKRSSPTAEERLTSERLELDLFESRKCRTASDQYMKEARQAMLAHNRRMVPVRPLS